MKMNYRKNDCVMKKLLFASQIFHSLRLSAGITLFAITICFISLLYIFVTTSIAYGADYLLDDQLQALDFIDEGNEYVIPLNEGDYEEGDELALSILGEQDGEYTTVMLSRELEVDESGKIHVDKDPYVIGVYNDENQEWLPANWMIEDKEIPGTWNDHNFFLGYLENFKMDFTDDINLKLVLTKNADGSLSYDYVREIDDFNENYILRNSEKWARFACSFREPTYTDSGLLKPFDYWESHILSVESVYCEHPETDLQFAMMKTSDFPDYPMEGQIVIKKNNGEYRATGLMAFHQSENLAYEYVDPDAVAKTGQSLTDPNQMTDSDAIAEPGQSMTDPYVMVDPDQVTDPDAILDPNQAMDPYMMTDPYQAPDLFDNWYTLDDLYSTEESLDSSTPQKVKLSSDGKILESATEELTGEYTIPASVKIIEENAFKNTKISKVIFPKSLEKINSYAFYGVPLNELELPDSLKMLGYGAFSTTSLSETETLRRWGIEIGYFDDISDYADEISQCGFRGMKVHIGPKVEYIGVNAFSGICVTEFEVDPDNPYYQSEDGMILSKDGKYLWFFPTGKGGDISLPEGIEIVHPDAFGGNGEFACLDEAYKGVEMLTLPSTMLYFNPNEIPKNLKRLKVNENLDSFDREGTIREYGTTKIEWDKSDEKVFYLSNDGKKVVFHKPESTAVSCTIPDSITYIAKNAFENANTRIMILPKKLNLSDMTVDEIADALNIIPNLQEINVEEDNENYCSIDGVLYTKDQSVLICYPSGKRDSRFEIPEGVKTIVNRAFRSNEYITQLSLPASLEYIDMSDSTKSIFDELKVLESLEISKDNPYYSYVDGMLISENDKMLIYYMDTGLDYLKIPEGVKRIANEVRLDTNSRLSDSPDPWSHLTIEMPESMEAMEWISNYSLLLLGGDIELIVPEGSYCEKYAIEHGFSYTLKK